MASIVDTVDTVDTADIVHTVDTLDNVKSVNSVDNVSSVNRVHCPPSTGEKTKMQEGRSHTPMRKAFKGATCLARGRSQPL